MGDPDGVADDVWRRGGEGGGGEEGGEEDGRESVFHFEYVLFGCWFVVCVCGRFCMYVVW